MLSWSVSVHCGIAHPTPQERRSWSCASFPRSSSWRASCLSPPPAECRGVVLWVSCYTSTVASWRGWSCGQLVDLSLSRKMMLRWLRLGGHWLLRQLSQNCSCDSMQPNTASWHGSGQQMAKKGLQAAFCTSVLVQRQNLSPQHVPSIKRILMTSGEM